MSTDPPISRELSEARARFDAACDRLRPDLHRFCTRMLGNPWDGEDVLHDALVLAFYHFDEVREAGSLKTWLFRIAHNKCIDFLRARRAFDALDEESGAPSAHEETAMDETLEQRQRAQAALRSIVTQLPAKERACLLLKDLLDTSLEETAEITGSSVGAVKAALHRGRTKLAQISPEPTPAGPKLDPRQRAQLERYLAAFNRRDWDAVRTLLAEDAQLQVVQRSEGPLRDAPYFTNYARLPYHWRLALARVDGIESVVHFRESDGRWLPHHVVQIDLHQGQVVRVRDYIHVEYMLRECVVEELEK